MPTFVFLSISTCLDSEFGVWQVREEENIITQTSLIKGHEFRKLQ